MEPLLLLFTSERCATRSLSRARCILSQSKENISWWRRWRECEIRVVSAHTSNGTATGAPPASPMKCHFESPSLSLLVPQEGHEAEMMLSDI